MSDSESDDAAAHAASMQNLAEKDPEFYKHLLENDRELLNFNDSEDEGEDDDEEMDEGEDDDEEMDEGEDDEEGMEDQSSGLLSPEKLEFIKDNIRTSPKLEMCKELMRSFRLALQQAEGTSFKTSMTNNELFNDIVKLCLLDLVPALQKVLKLSPEEDKKKEPTKSKCWKKVETNIKRYLIDMLKMFAVMNSPSVRVLLLKHTLKLIPYYKVFILLSKKLVKTVISLWSADEETVRVLALMVIVRTSKSFSKEDQASTLRKMYMAFIRNSKFTSVTTWPMINFMTRSLAELYSLNPELAYQHSFVYIRQMSIHLRNALTTHKKEAYRTVYNWQYIHCISLWSQLLCRLQDQEALKSLMYPLIQVIRGTINLIPTAKFIPLRVHLIKELISISEQTYLFIPVVPLILEILKIVDYNRKSNFSVKPVDFSVALKVTKSQLQEAGFKDACISEVCNLLVQYLKINCSSCSFPELTLPAFIQIKSFIKQCKVSKYNQQLKSVLTKIEENCLFISERRKMVTFPLSDLDQVKRWEDSILNQKPPMLNMKTELVTIKKAAVSDGTEKKKTFDEADMFEDRASIPKKKKKNLKKVANNELNGMASKKRKKNVK